jgi:hypothetical protein
MQGTARAGCNWVLHDTGRNDESVGSKSNTVAATSQGIYVQRHGGPDERCSYGVGSRFDDGMIRA